MNTTTTRRKLLGMYCPRCGKPAHALKGSAVGNYICYGCRWYGTDPQPAYIEEVESDG